MIDLTKLAELIQSLVDRLGRKMAMVIIGCYLIAAIPAAEVSSEYILAGFRAIQCIAIGIVIIFGVITQGKLDQNNGQTETKPDGNNS